jgi:gamma-glutamylputrescine oxidase
MHVDESPTYYWATKRYDLSFPLLQEELEAEVVIVGGGFSGINTALELAEQGVTDVVVLEGRHLGYGGTGRNGGQVMAGIGHDIETLRKDVGDEGVRSIFALSDLGPRIMRERIERYRIDADFRDGYVYLAYNARQAATLRGWEREFRALGTPSEIRYVEGSDLRRMVGSDVYHAGLYHGGGGHVHSLNLLLGEAKALTVRRSRSTTASESVCVLRRAVCWQASSCGPSTDSTIAWSPSCIGARSTSTRSTR